MEVGVRELKSHLSAYLDQVAAGAEVVVTDRGRPVARIVPVAAGSVIDRGIADGWIEPPRRQSLGPATPRPAARRIAELLDEDRG